MKTITLIAVLLAFVTLSSKCQSSTDRESINELQLEEMRNFLMKVEKADIPYSEKAILTYNKVKDFLQLNPGKPNYILWCKYLDKNHLDSLYALVDTSLITQMSAAIHHQKIRAGLTPGAAFPDLILPDSSGRPIDVSIFRGKIVLVIIWSSFCIPCREEIPKLKKLYNQYKDSGLVILGVSVDHDKTRWLTAITKDEQDWFHVCELLPWQLSMICNKWGISGIPYNFLIGRDGRLIDKEIGTQVLENRLKSVFQNMNY